MAFKDNLNLSYKIKKLKIFVNIWFAVSVHPLSSPPHLTRPGLKSEVAAAAFVSQAPELEIILNKSNVTL